MNFIYVFLLSIWPIEGFCASLTHSVSTVAKIYKNTVKFETEEQGKGAKKLRGTNQCKGCNKNAQYQFWKRKYVVCWIVCFTWTLFVDWCKKIWLNMCSCREIDPEIWVMIWTAAALHLLHYINFQMVSIFATSVGKRLNQPLPSVAILGGKCVPVCMCYCHWYIVLRISVSFVGYKVIHWK